METQPSKKAKQVATDYMYLTKECEIPDTYAISILNHVHPRAYEIARQTSSDECKRLRDYSSEGQPHPESPEEDLSLAHSI